MSSAWYERPAEDVFSELNTAANGLTSDEARRRLAEFGYNELTAKKRSTFVRFMLQFHNSMIYILLAAAFVTGVLLHELVDTSVILVSVLMTLTGFGVYYHLDAPALAPIANGGQVDTLLLTQAQTAAFVSIQLLHLGYLATARSVYRSAFTFSFASNRWVLLGMGLTIISQLLIVYVPSLQVIFRTAAFPAEWWLIISLALFPGFLAVELEKFIRQALGRRRTADIRNQA